MLAQRGSRVLLVDADLRRPGIDKLFGLASPHAGLSTVISGSSKVEDAIHPCPEVPSLWILPAGPIPPQPAELLGSTVMKEHIARWRNEFDHIIIDTPPCLSVTDAVLLSPEADRVILVARSGQTTRPALRRACDLLLQVNARVMGIVLNALNLRSAEGYYYYSGRYSKAYYSEESADDKPTPQPAKFLDQISNRVELLAQNTLSTRVRIQTSDADRVAIPSLEIFFCRRLPRGRRSLSAIRPSSLYRRLIWLRA